MKRSFSIHSITWVLMLALSASVNTSEAFTATSAIHSRVCGSEMPIVGSSLSSLSLSGSIESRSSTELQAKKKDISSDERGSDNVNALIGIDRGVYLWAIVIAINIWFFSIPVEFRRTKICNEADSRDYPTKCMTSKQFTTGIAEYYKNGKN
jgi:hypothetical protein